MPPSDTNNTRLSHKNCISDTVLLTINNILIIDFEPTLKLNLISLSLLTLNITSTELEN
jgi:hypothetical protein